jgi:predicted GIY-YIG superfamily endonuclease
MSDREWWVYTIQSQQVRVGKRGNALPGLFYVGMTVQPHRRLRQHNGIIKGGGRWTAKHRPHVLMAIYGPYANQSEALKAERALKKGRRGVNRCRWSPEDTYKGVSWCRGLGPDDPRIAEINASVMAEITARTPTV